MAEFKSKCPKCDNILTKKFDRCPKCGVKLNWGQAKTKSKSSRDTTSNTLLKGFYWFKTITYICPIFGVIMCILNKGYATNIKRDKQEYYRKFKQHTIICCTVWAILIVALIVITAINYSNQ